MSYAQATKVQQVSQFILSRDQSWAADLMMAPFKAEAGAA